MQTVFLELVKLSLIGSLFAVAVMLVRLVFRKAPKWLFCVLWGVVALRLICPVSIESNVSLVPDRLASGQIITNVGNEFIGDVDIIYENNAGYSNAVEAGRQPIYSGDGYYVVTEKDSLEAPKTVGETVYPILSWIWLAGVVLMLAYTAVSYFLLRKKMEEATQLRDNIWQCEQVDSPFVLGFLKPRIYLPYAITDSDMANVIAHEQAHIQRKDHWWKPIGFLLLSIHWFNPVLWLAYILLCRDIEAACDEKVIKHMEKDEMRAYSTALLHCSVHRRRIAACPLAFGETGVKERIKRVMNYKKPAFWIIVAAIVASAAVICCFLTSPKSPEPVKEYTITSYLAASEQTEVIEAYNRSNKRLFVTVNFNSTEGPSQIELVYQHKKNSTEEWTQSEPVIVSLGGSTSFSIPADNHFIIAAQAVGDSTGNVTFRITETHNSDASASGETGYYLLIGADGVESIEVSGPNTSGGVVNADESPFKKGEKVWLEHLQGVTDLRGYSITAYGKNGKIIYALSIPEGVTNDEVINTVSGGGWLLTPADFETNLSRVRGKTYVYENEGLMGNFTIKLYDDGTFTYYEGSASSYFGTGTWKQDGSTITLSDNEIAGYGLVNHFKLNGADLEFVEQNSSNFIYVKVKNGEKFHCTGETYKQINVFDTLLYHGGEQKLSLNDVIILSQKGYELGWSDFDKYKYYEAGSGLYIRVYPINEMFEVWIGGSAMPDQDDTPMYIYLRPSPINDVDQKIDIRDGGVTEFISQYSNGPVSALDAAITNAVLQKHEDAVPDGYLITESHIIVDKEIVSGTPSVGQTNHVREEIAYVYYLHLLFDLNENHAIEKEGIYQEAILTFDVDESGNYTLKRFLRPQYSAEYDEDLFKRFTSANEDIANNQEVYAERLLNKCWASATAYIENRNAGTYNPPSPVNQIFDNCLSWAGWTGDASLFVGALNSDQLQTNHTQHLPIYVFKSKAELDSFMTRMDEHLSMDEQRDEVPAFTETAAKYDEEFFKDNSLVLVYVTSGSWNTRYSATGFYCDGTSFVLHVEDTTEDDFGDAAMGGWFVSVVVDNKLIDGCSQFDAYLYNPLTE